jgi:hypothetical protein
MAESGAVRYRSARLPPQVFDRAQLPHTHSKSNAR